MLPFILTLKILLLWVIVLKYTYTSDKSTNTKVEKLPATYFLKPF